MKSLFFALALAVPMCVLVGCSSSATTNITEGASQEDLDNYERLIAEAEGDLAADEESNQLGQ
ncbi:hypothetical protein CA13_29700 [Planctomycetes bacterium CA13]|uniref:Secreted protein n=1 Tax=Novipirellula herctigrandis TaxID=2527986 RepID=A0A5C5Z3I6_9BACT|nr:hypothetical protein CA13_29700 [Planctomycetes bacterium CA13]